MYTSDCTMALVILSFWIGHSNTLCCMLAFISYIIFKCSKERIQSIKDSQEEHVWLSDEYNSTFS